MIVVVGNKVDLEDDRDVLETEGRDWAVERGFKFFETSAKTGSNVKELFDALAEIVSKKIVPGARAMSTNMTTAGNPDGCC
jgi:GTPase SAR1 family protein